MNNPYNTQTTPIREIIEKQLPYGSETIADLLLKIRSKNYDEPLMASFNGINDRLFSTAILHKETLWDFADALREYGFIDIIYITGGADYVFCRDKDGVKYDIGDSTDYPHEKWKGIVPWLVYRKNS